MKYSLKITQETGGESNVSLAEAEGKAVAGGVDFTYNFDGAEYRLLLTKDKMTHIRKGEIFLEMNFEMGKTTSCRISDGRNGGGFCIFTERLSVQFNGARILAECEFDDGADGEVTRITVLAVAV